MKEEIRSLLSELKAGLNTLYAERLKGVYLYGSYARGEEDPESDVDLLIVLEDFTRYGEEVGRTSALASCLSLKYGLSVTRVFLREQEWIAGDTPFLLNVREEAIAT